MSEASNNSPEKKQDVLQPVDVEARKLGKTLIRSARHAALGTLDTRDGFPLVSRVNLAADISGHPVFLISRLSAHFAALEADDRSSLLVGEPGKGDPVAHPRMTLIGRSERVDDAIAREQIRARFLMKHPKSELYVDFPDFAFWRFVPTRVSLNGGFARAYAPEVDDLVSQLPDIDALAETERGAVAHMNSDHRDAVDHYARLAGSAETGWTLATVDPEGVDLVKGDQTLRAWFNQPLKSATDLKAALIALARRESNR